MPRKILVVDDKLFMVRLIQHHLERAGFQLIKARNRHEAMQAIAQESPELVVMDESGSSPAPTKSSLQDFQDHPSKQNIPVIRMTDVPQDSDNNATDEVIFTKPFSPTQLVAEIKRLMPEL